MPPTDDQDPDRSPMISELESQHAPGFGRGRFVLRQLESLRSDGQA
jgi:hypothetical protein